MKIKRLAAFMVAAVMLISAVPITANAWTSGRNYVNFFIRFNCVQANSNGVVSSQSTIKYTDSLVNSRLDSKGYDTSLKVRIGDGVTTEEDVLSRVPSVPKDSTVLSKFAEKEMDKGYIIDNDGNVVSWSDLTTDNYEIEWFVLWFSESGTYYGWQIYGDVIDKDTKEAITVVTPTNGVIPAEAYVDSTAAPTVAPTATPETGVPDVDDTKPAADLENTNPSNTSYVYHFIRLDGIRVDSNGNVSQRATTQYTDVVANSYLSSKNYDSSFTIAIGDGVTEEDILSYEWQDSIPDDSDVLSKIAEQEMYNGYLLDNNGNVVSWSNLTTDNYDVEWYVLKFEDGSSHYGWHMDGRVIDKKTNDAIIIAIPTDGNIPDEAYAEPTVEPTAAPVVVEDDGEIDLYGASYAYIFGYSPVVTNITDEEGNVTGTEISIEMGADNPATVEEVCAMIVRMLDQAGLTAGQEYPVTDAIKDYEGLWCERSLAYMASVGGFDDVETVSLGNVKRGQVAKFISSALKISNTSSETPFVDIAESPYKQYIQNVYEKGYMRGTGDDTFDPDKDMTRAEFCQLFNNIIGRSDMGLTALDEEGNEYTVTPDMYYITDLDDVAEWQYNACMKATSAYDQNGYVDMELRASNMRNKLDNFDDQTKY